MDKLLLISNNKKVTPILEQSIVDCNYDLSYFKVEDEPEFFDFQVILIVEPIKIEKGYFSIFSIWKNYLAEKAQNTKLLIAGFKQVDHSNYINLLDFTKGFNWPQKIENALLPIEEWPEESNLKSAPEAQKKLSLFFTGHNHESIIDCISHVRATLNHATNAFYGSKILCIEPQGFIDVWQNIIIPGKLKLREFYYRWSNYVEYLEAMPFYKELKKVNAKTYVWQLNTFFSGRSNLSEKSKTSKENEFKELNAFRQIGDLTRALQTINKRYINPEAIANVLIIDDDKSFHDRIIHSFPDFNFYHAYNATEALELLNIKNFDLILSDLQLSGSGGNPLEGVDLIPKVKQIKADTPLAIASTHYKPSIIKRTLKNGADYFLTKSSFDIEKWNNVFVKLIGDHQYTTEQILQFNSPNENPDKSNILIVEDKKEWFDQLKVLSNDYNYDWANSVQQGFDLLEANPGKYDLLILDLYYPENGKEQNQGLKLLKEVKAIHPKLPVIIMTGSPKDKDTRKALELGADFYLIKPQFHGPIWLKPIRLLIEFKKLKEQLNS